jgi:hypothetical protein
VLETDKTKHLAKAETGKTRMALKSAKRLWKGQKAWKTRERLSLCKYACLEKKLVTQVVHAGTRQMLQIQRQTQQFHNLKKRTKERTKSTNKKTYHNNIPHTHTHTHTQQRPKMFPARTITMAYMETTKTETQHKEVQRETWQSRRHYTQHSVKTREKPSTNGTLQRHGTMG